MKRFYYFLTLLLALSPALLRAQAGAVDLTFNPGDVGFGNGDGDGTNHNVYTSFIQPDGKILIGGAFTSYNGTSRNHIARLLSDGILDNSFDPVTGANSIVRDIALQPDGKILIVGDFAFYDGIGRNRIARLNADGTLDLTFNPGTGITSNSFGGQSIYDIALQPDGKILIGGAFTSYNGTSRNHIARLNIDGTLDLTFNPGTGVNSTVYNIALQPDGKILIGGWFASYNGTTRNRIARLNADGTLDLTFNPGTGATGATESSSAQVETIAIQPDGKILIGGSFTSYNGTTRNRIARLNADGTLDLTFNPGTGANSSATSSVLIMTIALQPDGKILIGGIFNSYNGTTRNRIARINANGALDNTFNPGEGANVIETIALQPDGKIIIGGSFSSYNGIYRRFIARLNADGALDFTFMPGTGADARIETIALRPDGKILIGGWFTSYNGTLRNHLAQLNVDGTIDFFLDPGFGASAFVKSIAIQTDGGILIGGDFAAYNGVSRKSIARVNSDGTLDLTLDPGSGAPGIVEIIVIQPDGKIIIGGRFTSFNGTTQNRIARLYPDGTLDSAFITGLGASHPVEIITLQADGKILIGGKFTSYNGTTCNRIARLNDDGTLDLNFTPAIGANNTILDIAIQPNGKILIGGEFTSYDGIGRNRIARLNADGTLENTFNPSIVANGEIRDIALQPDGKIVIGGSFNYYNGTTRNGIARLSADGTLDLTFNPGTGVSSSVETITLQTDGKILIGGDFTSYDGIGRNRIARIFGTSSALCPGFSIDLGPDTLVVCGEDSVFLTAGAGLDEYLWSTGDSLSGIWVTGSGKYQLEAKQGICLGQDSVWVFLTQVSSSQQNFCPSDSTKLKVELLGLEESNIPEQGLLAWYPFDGNALDQSGNQRNGTVQGAVLGVDRFGRSNNGYRFDGVNDHVILGGVSSFPLANSSFSWSAWVKRNRINTNELLLQQGPTITNQGLHIGFRAWNAAFFAFYFNDLHSQSLYTDTTVWLHMAGTYDVSTGIRRMYCNGMLIARDSNVAPYSGSGQLYMGGGAPAFQSYFMGYIDDIALYNRSLTESEINQLYFGSPVSVAWSTGDIQPEITVSPNTSQTYPYTVSIGTYSCTDSMEVQVLPQLMVDLGADTVHTCDVSFTLNAGPGFEGYLWNKGDTLQSVVAHQSGWYRVTVFQQGCTASDSVFVNLNGFDIRASDSLVCPGDEMSLSLISKVNGPGDGVHPANYAPTQNLLGWWDFKGNAQDRSGNANHGTVNGAVLTNDRFGNANAAYSFDGIDDYIETTNAIPITGNAPRSVSVWFSLSSFNPGWNTLLNFGQPCPNAGTSNSLQVDNLTRLIFKANGINDDASFASVVANRWYHFVWTFDGSLSRIYLDGVLIPNDYSNVPKTLATTLTTLKIGFDYSSLSCNSFHHQFNRPFKGSIDDIGIWSRALTADEVYALYSGIPVNSTVLWSTGDTTQTISITPAQTTIYYCTVSDAIGSCTDSVTIYVNPIPQVDLGPDTLLVCGQDSLYLEAGSGFDSYLWNTGDTTSGIWVTHSNPYWVRTEQGGCVASDSLYVRLLDSRIRGYLGTIAPDEAVVLFQDTSSFINAVNTPPAIPNYTYWINAQNRYVYTSNTSMPWNTAREQAAQIGGEMAWVKSATDNYFFQILRFNAGPNDDWWLGASDAQQEGVWKWNDGSALTYTNWATPQPDDFQGNQDYLRILQDGFWDDIAGITYCRTFLFVPIPLRPKYLWSTGDTTASIQLSSRTDTLVWCTVTQNGFSCTDTLLIEVEAERRIGTMDLEAHRYTSLVISNLEWMDRNYAGAHFANRDSIALVSNNAQWSSLNAPGSGSIPGNALNDSLYGKLYNGLAATDSRGLCPYGWRVATDTDWQNLVNYVGDSTTAGGLLKDPLYWTPTNVGATNLFDFSARGAGYRHFQNGLYDRKDLIGYWWSPENGDTTSSLVKIRRMRRQNAAVDRYDSPKAWGFSCRCVRDAAIKVDMPMAQIDSLFTPTDSSAAVSASITQAGNDPQTQFGVVYATHPMPGLLDEAVFAPAGSQSAVLTLSQLLPETTYYLRAFARNAAGYAYGPETSLLTDCRVPQGVPVLTGIQTINLTKYQITLQPVSGSQFRLEARDDDDSTWRVVRSWGNTGLNSTFYYPDRYGRHRLRLAAEINGQWVTGCPDSLEVACQPLSVEARVVINPQCADDSVLVKAVATGGVSTKTYRWSNGATTQRTELGQGGVHWVEATDYLGCTAYDTLITPVVDSAYSPYDLVVTKNGPVLFELSWQEKTYPPGVQFLLYRVQYRLAGLTTWTNHPAVFTNQATVDFTSSGLPAGNYEFQVNTRYRIGSVNYNSAPSCIVRRGYNGSGNKSDGSVWNTSDLTPGFSIYPNPSQGLFYVWSAEAGDYSLTDLSGKVLLRGSLSADAEQALDLSAFTAGVYLIHLNGAQGQRTERVVKQ